MPLAVSEGESRNLIQGALAIAREHLAMDIAWVAEFTGDKKIFRVVEGDADGWDLHDGDTMPGADSYCQRMLDGRIPSAVPDTAQNPELKELAVTRRLGIVAYIGVPLVLADGGVYGAFCCASHETHDGLGDPEVKFVRVLSRLVARELDYLAAERVQQRAAVREAATQALLAALAARDAYSGEHSTAVVDLAERVATAQGLDDDVIEDTRLVALLHDIGKVAIPDDVLRKPGPLDEDEWRLVREHSAVGGAIVAAIDGIAHLAPAVRATHERWDGAGYPDGLSGDAIPVAARIAAVCDAYDAMVTDRPYRKALDVVGVLQEIRDNSGSQFCPHAAEALLTELTAAAPHTP